MAHISRVCESLWLYWLAAALPLWGQHEPDKNEKKEAILGDLKSNRGWSGLFASGCAACHGSEGQGGRGPNLREHVYWHPIDDETLYRAIGKRDFRRGGCLRRIFPRIQTWQVVAFVEVAGFRRRSRIMLRAIRRIGGELFWGKAGCGGCPCGAGSRGQAGAGSEQHRWGAGAAAASSGLSWIRMLKFLLGIRAPRCWLKNGKKLRGVARNRT